MMPEGVTPSSAMRVSRSPRAASRSPACVRCWKGRVGWSFLSKFFWARGGGVLVVCFVAADSRRALHHHHTYTQTHLTKDVDQAGVRHVVGLHPVLRHPRQQRPRALRPLLRRLQCPLLHPIPSSPCSCLSSSLIITNPPPPLPRVVDRRRVVHHVQPPPDPPQRRHQGDDLLRRRCRRRGCTAGAVRGRGGGGEETDGSGDGAVVYQGQPVLRHVLQL